MEDLTGKQFGSYQIIAPLGAGGMAAVYKAYQPAMERHVALKVLPRHMSSSEEFVNRFRREARLLAQLQHPHILPVFDYGESEGYPYIVMPFILSGTLADILRNQRLSFSEVRRIMTQIGDALSYAHARGMIHRDIKPSNILIDERGNCLLTDFGLARMAEAAEKLTSSGSILGTPAYLSPEQATGFSLNHRSDLYSLGVVLYEMVTGHVPYTAETPYAVVYKHVHDPLPSARKSNPKLSEALELVIRKSLSKNPDDRYQTADEFTRAIQQAIPESGASEQKLAPELAATVPPTPPAEQSPIFELQAIPVQPDTSHEQPRIERGSKPRGFPVWALGGIGALVLAVLVLTVVMNRPNAPITETVTPTATSTIIPTGTPMPVVSPTDPWPTFTPQNPTVSENNFTDIFENQLGEGWEWLAEDPSRWSLTEVPGWLQIMASDASFDGPSFPTNVLLRDAPAGDFEMTTLLRFAPTSNFQVAGLVVFQDKANVLQFGHGFCDLADACVGDGIYFDNLEGGFIVENHKAAFGGSEIYLRLQRAGTTYAASYSEDGENWTLLGEHIRDLSQPRVGLIAAQAAEAIPAQFDYFTLTSLNE
jgi:serine/threonine protein kinase